eukprot:gene5145-6981_t
MGARDRGQRRARRPGRIDDRVLRLRLLVALDRLLGVVAGLALLIDDLDAVHAAVALVDHRHVVAHAVADRDAGAGVIGPRRWNSQAPNLEAESTGTLRTAAETAANSAASSIQTIFDTYEWLSVAILPSLARQCSFGNGGPGVGIAMSDPQSPASGRLDLMAGETMDEIDIHLGRRLRRRRRLLGLTQQELAETCGVRFQQIQKYECGANRISASRLWQLSEALEVPVGYFYDGLSDADRRELQSESAGEGGEMFARKETLDLIRAYDIKTGKELWKGRLPAGGNATPMTYWSAKSGRQFVVITAGGHGGILS